MAGLISGATGPQMWITAAPSFNYITWGRVSVALFSPNMTVRRHSPDDNGALIFYLFYRYCKTDPCVYENA